MFFAYIFLIGLRLCHRTCLFFFRYDVQWYQRSGGSLFFLFLFLFLFLFFSSFFFPPLFHMKAHDFGGGMIFGYGYGSLFYVHGHSTIVTFSGTTLPVARSLPCLYISSPINFVRSDMFSFRFLRARADK